MNSNEQKIVEINSLLQQKAEVRELPDIITRHKIEIEDDEIKFNHDNTYKSCCFRCDKRALNYFTQAVFSGAIISFCIAMLATNQDCATFSRYSPLLTFIIGIWVPNPNMNPKN